MSTTLWKIDPQKLCTVTADDLDLILIATYRADDGTYYLDKKLLAELKRNISNETYLALEKEIDANDSINFIIG